MFFIYIVVLMMGECGPLCCRADALCLQKYNFLREKVACWRHNDGKGKGER